MIGINSLKRYPHAEAGNPRYQSPIDVFSPVRRWLNQLDIRDATFARSLCRVIPAQCPFARTVAWQGRTLMVIPPLCKLNPVYDELVSLRFRALSYLADQDQHRCPDRPITAHPTPPC